MIRSTKLRRFLSKHILWSVRKKTKSAEPRRTSLDAVGWDGIDLAVRGAKSW